MLRFFAREHHAGLNEAMDEQIALPGTTEFGRRYNSGLSRGSGSLETANFNSVDTAFIGYCAQRSTTVNGAKKSPPEAWAALGVYGGDDSLEGEVDADALGRSAKLMGQEYEIEVVRRGDIGVNFLNRQFGPDVWNGDPNSMANPARLLTKLWVGPAHLAQPLVRFGERLSGYYRMDRNSPVIGPITEVSHELLGEQVDGVLMPWDGQYSAEVNWPNEDSGWMQNLFDQFVPDFDHDRFRSWIKLLRDKRDPGLLLRAPLCTTAGASEPVTVKKVCIVGDTLEFPALEVSADTGDHAHIEPSELEEGEVKDEATSSPPVQPLAGTQAIYSGIPEDDQRFVIGMDGSIRLELSDVYWEAEEAVGPPQEPERGRFKPKTPAPKPDTNGKGPKGKEKDSTKGSPRRVDPREWERPALRKDEAKKAYEERLLKWERTRERVAQRLGVSLTGAPKGAAKK